VGVAREFESVCLVSCVARRGLLLALLLARVVVLVAGLWAVFATHTPLSYCCVVPLPLHIVVSRQCCCRPPPLTSHAHTHAHFLQSQPGPQRQRRGLGAASGTPSRRRQRPLRSHPGPSPQGFSPAFPTPSTGASPLGLASTVRARGCGACCAMLCLQGPTRGLPGDPGASSPTLGPACLAASPNPRHSLSPLFPSPPPPSAVTCVHRLGEQ
jgi:hypothetical protein